MENNEQYSEETAMREVKRIRREMATAFGAAITANPGMTEVIAAQAEQRKLDPQQVIAFLAVKQADLLVQELEHGGLEPGRYEMAPRQESVRPVQGESDL